MSTFKWYGKVKVNWVSLQTSSELNNGLCVFITSCFFADGDPEKAHKQELCGLHGALQGEQVSECEERLWRHSLLSRHEFPLQRQDDHPQGQTSQWLDVTLNNCWKWKKYCRSELFFLHLWLSPTVALIVTVHTHEEALFFSSFLLCATSVKKNKNKWPLFLSLYTHNYLCLDLEWHTQRWMDKRTCKGQSSSG